MYDRKRTAYVYAIVHTETNNAYIGSTVDFEKRVGSHWKLLDLNAHTNRYLQRAYNEYGKGKFAIALLHICKEKDRVTLEKQCIKNWPNNVYNIFLNNAR